MSKNSQQYYATTIYYPTRQSFTSVWAKFMDIYLQGMPDRSMQSRMEWNGRNITRRKNVAIAVTIKSWIPSLKLQNSQSKSHLQSVTNFYPGLLVTLVTFVSMNDKRQSAVLNNLTMLDFI